MTLARFQFQGAFAWALTARIGNITEIIPNGAGEEGSPEGSQPRLDAGAGWSERLAAESGRRGIRTR
jgi:hypothetical protein